MKKITIRIISLTLCIALAGGISMATALTSEHEDPHGIILSMTVDSYNMLITGEEYTLKNAPFVQSGIPYVPLREVVELCGGLVRYNSFDQSVLVSLPRYDSEPVFSQIWIGKQRVLNNAAEEAPLNDSMYPEGAREAFVPILKSGRVFVPAGYFSRFNFFALVRYDEQAGRIWIDNFDDGNSLGGFALNSDFLSYDAAVRSRFNATGEIEIIDNGALKNEIFTDGDIELCIRSGEARYMKHEGTRQEIHMITLVSNKYCTPRGLRVGDSEERYLALYGAHTQFLKVELQNGMISRISIFAID